MLRQTLASRIIRKFRKIQSKIFQQNKQDSQDKAIEAREHPGGLGVKAQQRDCITS